MRIAPHLIATARDFAEALRHADAMERFDRPAAWAVVCGAFDKLDMIRGFSKGAELRYSELARERCPSALRARVEADIGGGSFGAAFAASRQSIPHGWPLAAWSLDGPPTPVSDSSLALLRILLWMGFEVDARDSQGRSSLDIALDAKAGRRAQPRAVRILLEAGANPDSLDADGDTPLMSLARGEHWTNERDECARALMEAGADPIAREGPDGFRALLARAQRKWPTSMRERLIAELDRSEQDAGLSGRMA